MQELSVINSIKRGVISPIYLLSGTEEYLQEMVIDALKDALVATEIGAFNLDELEGEEVTIGSIVDIANTLPVFAEKRLVIVKNAPFLQGGSKKKSEVGKEESAEESASEKREETKKDSGDTEVQALLKYLADPLLSTCLVFWQKGSVSKNRKVYKAIAANKGQIVVLNQLKGRDAPNWLILEAKKRGKVLEPKAADYLSFNCGNQLRDLHNELEKLFLYCQDDNNITLPIVQRVATKSSEGNIFSLVDYLGEKKGEEALGELRNLLITGEPPVKINFMIARQFRLFLLAKDMLARGKPKNEIAAHLHLHPYVTNKIMQQINNFSFPELERSLELICESDLLLKSRTNQKLTLENLVLTLCR